MVVFKRRVQSASNLRLLGRTSNSKWLSMLVINLLVLMTVSTALAAEPAQLPEQAQSEGQIKILPIDKTRLLIGEKFDLRVEVNGAKPDSLDVTINGQPAAQALQGAKEERTNASDKSGEVTYRQVSITTPGAVTVEAKAKVGGKDITKKVTWSLIKLGAGQAKNVILFIGDGMSFPTITATRMVSRGLTEGKYNSFLEMDRMQYRGAVTTSGYDALVTDSANSASAYGTGNKAVVNAMGVYEDNTASPFDDPKVENIIEMVKRSRNMATGLVTTADITDATPAAFAAHTRRRAEQAFIASTYLDPAHQPEVLMGGGSKWFLPKAKQGASMDDKDLVETFKGQGYGIATSKTDLKGLPGGTSKILGLFHTGTMNVYMDREVLKDPDVLGVFKDQPSLIDMSDAAISTLSKNPNGFFLMVEGGSIDKQLHPMDWQRAIYDAIEMDKALGNAKKFQQQNPDTLIVVVADHSHSMSIYGTYSEADGKKGADAVGVYQDAKFPTFTYSKNDGFPDDPNPSRTLAIAFGNHPQYNEDFGAFKKVPLAPAIEDPNNKGKYIANPKRGNTGVVVPSNLPANEATEVHTADDVPLMASGPGAFMANGVLDNTDVFFMMVSALGIDLTAPGGKATGTITGGTIGDPANPLMSQGGAAANPGTGAATNTNTGAATNTNTSAATNAGTGTGGTTTAAKPAGVPATGIGGQNGNASSDFSTILWVLLAVIGLAISFGGGLLVARRQSRS